MNKHVIKYLAVSIFLLLPLPLFAKGASLRLLSGSGVYKVGSPFKVRVSLNSGGGVGVNAGESGIKFDPAYFKINKISTDNSIYKLWAEKPSFVSKTGTVFFRGGIPAGSYKGSAGKLFEIELTPLKKGKTNAEFTSSILLSADGKGKNITESSPKAKYIIGSTKEVTASIDLVNKLVGRILLQVEKNGEAWYIYPKDAKRYYLGRPDDAFSIMRNLGLGATHKYITSYKTYPKNMLGKILLDVEKNGEAYYINPVDKKGYYLGRPADAFAIMRKLGLGISDDTLDRIPDWAI